MRNFQQKGRWRRVVESPLVLLVLAVLILFFAWAVIGFTIKMMATAKNKKVAEEKIAQLKLQKEKLTGDLERLETERGLEESIREKFGFAKEGEGLIVVVDEGEAEPEPPSTAESFLLFFKNMFR